ncbi:MAG: hypothetical protein Q9227_005466 [Pyrenula ochraceoflavens]
MHKGRGAPLSDLSQQPTEVQSSCPVKGPQRKFWAERWASQEPSETSPSQPPPPEPSERSSTLSALNPLNHMPSTISNTRSQTQITSLPLDRETSSIPRGDSTAMWEYPSPQQMYNAMLRKGYTDTPIDAVESMVAVHNFLNEGAWQEIETWESMFNRGLREGWEKCRRGEENMAAIRAAELARGTLDEEEGAPRLVRFMGRPGDLTPKARMLQVMGWLYPSKFHSEPPFDRHDWYVARRTPSGQKEVRYVIDYYSGDPEPTGEPVFYLDIRPAIDTPTAAVERMMRWGGDVWHKASGQVERERIRAEKTAKATQQATQRP